jgi:hypothetical protein
MPRIKDPKGKARKLNYLFYTCPSVYTWPHYFLNLQSLPHNNLFWGYRTNMKITSLCCLILTRRANKVNLKISTRMSSSYEILVGHTLGSINCGYTVSSVCKKLPRHVCLTDDQKPKFLLTAALLGCNNSKGSRLQVYLEPCF